MVLGSSPPPLTIKRNQAEAEVVPSSSLVEIDVEVEVVFEVKVGVEGEAGVELGNDFLFCGPFIKI